MNPPRTFVSFFILALAAACTPAPGPTPSQQALLPSPSPTQTRSLPTRTPTLTLTALPTLRPTGTPFPTWTPFPTLTPRPSRTPTPAVVGIGSTELPYLDDFSDPLSGWPEGGACEGSYGYGPGHYVMVNGQPFCPLCVSRNRVHTDAVIDIQITKNGGSDDAFFGVTCRKTGENNYYALMINGNGQYRLVRSVGGIETFLATGSSGAIRRGNASNHLIGSCVDNVISLNVNGRSVASVLDPTFLSGSFLGMIVQTQAGVPVEVSFDDFEAVAP